MYLNPKRKKADYYYTEQVYAAGKDMSTVNNINTELKW